MKLWLNKYKTLLMVFIIMLITITIILIGFISNNNSQKTVYNDGIYYNHAYGYHSEIKVKVIVKGGVLYQIEILEHEEPKILADIVFEQMPLRMLKQNTADVDVISGATYTSKSLIEAVSKALEQAKIQDE